MVGVYVARTGGTVRVAVTGAGPCAFRWTDAEAALAANFAPAAIDAPDASTRAASTATCTPVPSTGRT